MGRIQQRVSEEAGEVGPNWPPVWLRATMKSSGAVREELLSAYSCSVTAMATQSRIDECVCSTLIHQCYSCLTQRPGDFTLTSLIRNTPHMAGPLFTCFNQPDEQVCTVSAQQPEKMLWQLACSSIVFMHETPALAPRLDLMGCTLG